MTNTSLPQNELSFWAPKIRYFNTNPSLQNVISTQIRMCGIHDVSKWQICKEVTCRSDGFYGTEKDGPFVEVTGKLRVSENEGTDKIIAHETYHI